MTEMACCLGFASKESSVEEVSTSADGVRLASWSVVFTYEFIFTKDFFFLLGILTLCLVEILLESAFLSPLASWPHADHDKVFLRLFTCL